jgi:hypothetical protein
MSNEKSWKEIGATIGAAVDLASYAHAKLSDSKPVAEPEPVRQASTVDRTARDRADARVAVPFICAVIAVIGIAAAFFFPKPVAQVRPVCQFASTPESASGASSASMAVPASAVPLNPPCQIPYNDGLTTGEHIAGHAVKLAIFSLL